MNESLFTDLLLIARLDAQLDAIREDIRIQSDDWVLNGKAIFDLQEEYDTVLAEKVALRDKTLVELGEK